MHACIDDAVAAMRACSMADSAKPTTGKEPLQVRIPTAVKRAFKSAAALRSIEPNELFVEVWEHYEQTHPNNAPGDAKWR
jgi:hypothetical protein